MYISHTPKKTLNKKYAAIKLELPIVAPFLDSNGRTEIPIFSSKNTKATMLAAMKEDTINFLQSAKFLKVEVRTKKKSTRCIQLIVPAILSKVLQKLRSTLMPVNEVTTVINRKKPSARDNRFNFGRNALFGMARSSQAKNITSVDIQKNIPFGTTNGKKNEGCTIRGAKRATYAPQRIIPIRNKPSPPCRVWGRGLSAATRGVSARLNFFRLDFLPTI